MLSFIHLNIEDADRLVQGEISRCWYAFFFLISQENWPMLRLLKYFLSKSAASSLECLADSSGDVNRSIYSNLCLDRKNGYQHACPRLEAPPRGAELSTCASGRRGRSSPLTPAASLLYPRSSLSY